MCDDRCRSGLLQSMDALFGRSIRDCHTLVLAQMLAPGCDNEGFEQAFEIGRIAKQAPAPRAIAAANDFQRSHGLIERILVRQRNPILHRHQHWAIGCFHRVRG